MPASALAPVDGLTIRPRFSRLMGLGATLVLHALVATLAIAYEWYVPQQAERADKNLRVNILPVAQDRAIRRRERPVAMRKSPPMAAPVMADLPPPVLSRSLAAPVAPVASGAEPSLPAAPQKVDRAVPVVVAYRLEITQRLAQHRHYPEAALIHADQGSGVVEFRIDRHGRLLNVVMQRSTGHPGLDRAAMKQVKRAAPFPAIPDELPDELTLTLPLHFLIRAPDRMGEPL